MREGPASSAAPAPRDAKSKPESARMVLLAASRGEKLLPHSTRPARGRRRGRVRVRLRVRRAALCCLGCAAVFVAYRWCAPLLWPPGDGAAGEEAPWPSAPHRVEPSRAVTVGDDEPSPPSSLLAVEPWQQQQQQQSAPPPS